MNHENCATSPETVVETEAVEVEKTEAIEVEETEAVEVEGTDNLDLKFLDQINKQGLCAFAANYGVSVSPDSMNKDEMIAKIKSELKGK